jgi:hypothetical protein
MTYLVAQLILFYLPEIIQCRLETILDIDGVVDHHYRDQHTQKKFSSPYYLLCMT